MFMPSPHLPIRSAVDNTWKLTFSKSKLKGVEAESCRRKNPAGSMFLSRLILTTLTQTAAGSRPCGEEVHAVWCFFGLVLVITGLDEMGILPMWEHIARETMVVVM